MGLLCTKLERPSEFKTGKLDLITDVPGLRVGHVTISSGEIQTGVTAIIPGDDIYHVKKCAACHVINGFGKTAGLVQVNELGLLESPIILTNTLQVGTAWQGLCKYLVQHNQDLISVNPVVAECNDGYLNDIRHFSITEDMVFEAINQSKVEFPEGAVGAGRGMICHQLSGGIGSASRVIELDKKEYTLGAMVLANHGLMKDLTIYGENVGARIEQKIAEKHGKVEDVGSVIVIIATDIPLDAKQLERVSHRAVVGLSRTGSKMGHGSGEVVLAFTTSNDSLHVSDEAFHSLQIISNQLINQVFRMTVDVVEEAVLSALWHAERVVGFQNRTAEALANYL